MDRETRKVLTACKTHQRKLIQMAISKKEMRRKRPVTK
jgi:hypothetical protein